MPTRPDPVETKKYKLVPEGTHVARCYGFLHLGHVPNTYPGAENPTINKIRLTWELPEEKVSFAEGEEPKPYSISAEYTLSMHEKSNLRKIVQSWLGKQFTEAEAVNFDAESLVGQACFITVAHMTKEDKTFAYVENVTRLPARMEAPDAINAPKITNWETLTKEQFDSFPEFIQEKLKSALEYQRWNLQKKSALDAVDYPEEKINAEDIPF